MLSQAKNIQHLYSRAAFGLKPGEYEMLTKKGINENVDLLFRNSKEVIPLNVLNGQTDYMVRRNAATKEEKNDARMALRQQIISLNIEWLTRLATDEAQLRERMVFFWHNHFACRALFPGALQQLNNIMREHALGNFRTLLMSVSQSPAMLMFLNNQQNRKQHPNENFARELMELFTLGRGNYSEQDVKESARAFTGWSFDFRTGEFLFRERLHDDDEKHFLGKHGRFTGEDIIDIILEQKQTALFITKKIYGEFVNDRADDEQVKVLAENFYNSNYDISKLMQEIFSSDWFYDEKNIGVKIKSPVELLVGLNRTFNITYQKTNVLMVMQNVLGQFLFRPPNVAGWPGGRNWIDSSSLMFRLKIPSLVLNNGVIEIDTKEDDDLQDNTMTYETKKKRVTEFIAAKPDWENFVKTLPAKISGDELAERLLLPKLSSQAKNSVENINKEELKTVVVELLSLPEYQMC